MKTRFKSEKFWGEMLTSESNIILINLNRMTIL